MKNIDELSIDELEYRNEALRDWKFGLNVFMRPSLKPNC